MVMSMNDAEDQPIDHQPSCEGKGQRVHHMQNAGRVC